MGGLFDNRTKTARSRAKDPRHMCGLALRGGCFAGVIPCNTHTFRRQLQVYDFFFIVLLFFDKQQPPSNDGLQHAPFVSEGQVLPLPLLPLLFFFLLSSSSSTLFLCRSAPPSHHSHLSYARVPRRTFGLSNIRPCILLLFLLIPGAGSITFCGLASASRPETRSGESARTASTAWYVRCVCVRRCCFVLGMFSFCFFMLFFSVVLVLHTR